jgi:hypothetical protein
MPKEVVRQAPEPSRADLDFNRAVRKIHEKYGSDLSAFLSDVRRSRVSETKEESRSGEGSRF